MTQCSGRVILVFVLAALVCFAQETSSRPSPAMRLIVMVNAALDGGENFGGGIIFGRSANGIFIVTANHVVRRGSIEAGNIRVKLRDASNTAIEAALLPNADKEMDVAVLKVTILRGHNFDPCSLTMDALGNVEEVRRGDGVYPVGAPNGIPWAMPVVPDRVAQLLDGQVIFQSSFITVGHSGGALLSENGQLLAMISADAPPFGRSISLGQILPKLRGWGYPVELRIGGSPSPLLAAVQSGEAAKVTSALAAPCNEVHTELEGETPLHEAARRGAAPIVRLLLAAGARTDYAALYLAAEQGNPAVVRALLEAGGIPQPERAQDRSPLDVAVWRGNADAARLLVKAGAKTSSIKVDLHDAARAGSLETLKLLVEFGAQVNQRDREGLAAIHVAVRERRPAVIAALLDAGADVNLPDGDGQPPLHMAILSAWTSDRPAEKKAALEMVGLLISRGAKLDMLQHSPGRGSSTGEGHTPLTLAAEFGQVDIVKMLLDKGVGINTTDNAGRTALHYAAELSASRDVRDMRPTQLEMIQLLLQRGANVNAIDTKGDSPLCRALRGDPVNPRIKIAEILLKAGARTLSDWERQCSQVGRSWVPDASINELLRSYGGK